MHHSTEPEFETFKISLNRLCNNYRNIPFTIELWDEKHDGALLLETVDITINDMVE